MELIFQIAECYFSIAASDIVTLSEPKAVFQLPFIRSRYCLGFISERGQAVPILNLMALLGVAAAECESGKVIIFAADNLMSALMVDKVLDVEALPTKNVITQENSALVSRVCEYQGQLVQSLITNKLAYSLQEVML